MYKFTKKKGCDTNLGQSPSSSEWNIMPNREYKLYKYNLKKY